MPFYQKQGQLPNKRHIQFRDSSNNLFWEELVSREGFSYIYSNLYHKNPPTEVEIVGEIKPIIIEEWKDITFILNRVNNLAKLSVSTHVN